MERLFDNRKLSPDSIKLLKASPLPSKSIDVGFQEAISNPISAESLDREKFWSPAVVFADHTRKPSPFLPHILKLFEDRTDDIKIICAGGSHVSSGKDHVSMVLGDDLYKRFQSSIFFSATKNPNSKYEWIGATSRGTPVEVNKEILDRDLILVTLNVQPHYFAGYEGGAKGILPGCSGLKTITSNHARVIGNMYGRELVIKSNPVREDMNEVPGLLADNMKIKVRNLDFVLNQDGSFVKAAFGDPVQAHMYLSEQYSRKIHTAVSRPAGVVLSVADGPLGRNLYQALKAAAFGSNIVAPNHQPKSIVVLIATLEDGVGGEAFKHEMELYGKMDNPVKVIEDLRRRAKEGKITEASQKANRLALDDSKCDLVVVSPTAPKDVQELLSKTKYAFYRGLDEALGGLDSQLLKGDIIGMPFGSSTVPIPE